MSKKINFRTPKAETLKKAYDALNAEYQAEEARCKKVFYEYCDLEGKYGKVAVGPWDCGQGLRGYHYEYASPELEKQERAEREQFLKDNNYRTEYALWLEYRDRLNDAENAFYLEQYGMTAEAYKAKQETERKAKRYRQELAELNERKAYLEKWLADNGL